MGLLGISLLVASVVCICLRPEPFMNFLGQLWRGQGPVEAPPPTPSENGAGARGDTAEKTVRNGQPTHSAAGKADANRAAMPPPPPVIQRAPPPGISTTGPDEEGEEEQTTPKAAAAAAEPASSVPTFSLTSDDQDEQDHDDIPSNPPMFPAANSAQRARGPVTGTGTPSTTMPPPPPPPSLSTPNTMAPPPRRSPAALSPNATPPKLSPLPNRNLPLPNRGPLATQQQARGGGGGGGGGSLALPPTHTTRPASKKVQLTPGHSPLDWARLSSSPTSDLRNLPASTPYLRVTPSVLKTMNGRKGKDAWTALGGRVYNISPYVPFHPGGAGELLRCAGKDGNKLFGEVHPWVNYETMLAACLVGILVEEGDTGASQMDEMD